jgi:AGCS family alanine or glycine:cation symporter
MIVWSDALIVLCLGTGLYFSHKNTFLQIRHIKEMFRLLFDGKSSESGVSSFKHYQCHWQVEWVQGILQV